MIKCYASVTKINFYPVLVLFSISGSNCSMVQRGDRISGILQEQKAQNISEKILTSCKKKSSNGI